MNKLEGKREYYKNGNIQCESHVLNGGFHREGGPAYIRYNENGSIRYECYIINRKHHREDGPAIIRYHENGNVWYEEYYLNGRELTKDEWYQRLTTKQKVNLLYGKGNE
jgi:antitoxin component YwqK of YwqJK toxin-antitoxin module